MPGFSRRLFLLATALATTAASTRVGFAQEASGAASVPLEEALKRRQSTRMFSPQPLADGQIERLLWAANGINRPEDDGHTVPSWRSSRDVTIYVAGEDGVGRYDPAKNALESVIADDIRASVTTYPWAGRAAAVLIYVSDRAKIVEATGGPGGAADAQIAIGAHVNSALMAQNVYLFCAAEGIGTCLIGGGADREAITKALSLPEGDTVTYIQPVGNMRA